MDPPAPPGSTFRQFIRYSFCGVMATAVQTGGFYLLAWLIWPSALDDSVADPVRRTAAVKANVAAFPISNTVAYALNVRWVFGRGRHRRVTEFLLFQLVSAISFAVGLLGGPQLIEWFGVSTHLAQGSFIASSAMANFIARKFLVFRKS